MGDILSAAGDNLNSPPILFFVLGLIVAQSRSTLKIPEQIAQFLSYYLILAIGFKGGYQIRESGIDAEILLHLVTAMVLGAALPFIAFALLRTMTRLGVNDAAAVAAHYGSVSLVTFVTATEFLVKEGVGYEGHLVGMLALMEFPAVVVAIALAQRYNRELSGPPWQVAMNGSVILLIGSLVIGYLSGDDGYTSVEPFTAGIFQGMLTFFLLEMGMQAGKRLGEFRSVGLSGAAFGIYMPVIGALLGASAGAAVGLSTGGVMLLTVLCASASYIVAPAAVRLAIPEANPSIYLTLALGITFPLNLTIGIPVYYELATVLT